MKVFLMGFVLISFFSCGTSKTKLTEKARDMKILKSKKKRGCDVVAKVVGMNDDGTVELAKNHARNLAVKEGGNAIYFDDLIKNGREVKVYGVAYHCRQ